MEQLGPQIVDYHSDYAMDDREGFTESSSTIHNTINSIKDMVDTLDYLLKTSIYIESKRLAIDIINEYYNIASAVIYKKLLLDFHGTKEAYLQSENVDTLMVELVEKLEE